DLASVEDSDVQLTFGGASEERPSEEPIRTFILAVGVLVLHGCQETMGQIDVARLQILLCPDDDISNVSGRRVDGLAESGSARKNQNEPGNADCAFHVV